MTMPLVQLDALESRRLMAFAHLDPSFGNAGTLYAPTGDFAPVSDGSVISFSNVDGVNGLTRRDASGKINKKFGTNGVFNPYPVHGSFDQVGDQSFTGDLAVDRSTGNIAFVRKTYEGEKYYGPDDEESRSIYSYDLFVGSSLAKKVKLAAPAVQAKIDAGSLRRISFDSRGRLLVEVVNAAQTEIEVTRLLPGGTEVDTSFASQGTLTLSPFSELLLNPDGGLTVVKLKQSAGDYETYDQTLRIERYTSAGVRDTKFGKNGVLTRRVGGQIASGTGYDYTYDRDVVRIVGASAAPDGSVVLALVRAQNSRQAPRVLETYYVQRIRLNGTVALPAVLPMELAPPEYLSGNRTTILFDDTYAYLINKGRSYEVYEADLTLSTRLSRIDFRTGVVDADYTGEGGSRFSNSFMHDAAAIDAKGRLLLRGTRQSLDNVTDRVLIAVDGVGGLANPTAKPALFADGTLDVPGTSKGDVINVRLKRGKLEVIVNGVLSRFDASAVTGIVVHSGKGDDRVTLYSTVKGVHVQAGAGNDTIYGSATGDVIEGGDGNDRIDAGNGLDEIYGDVGNDTLIGGGATDRIFGGIGDDELQATDAAGTPELSTADLLWSGPGSDRIVRAKPTYPGLDPELEVWDADQHDTLI